MSRHVLLLIHCTDPRRVGGKAAGLGDLIRHGFRVPPGCCLAISAYEEALHAIGFDAAQAWSRLRRASAEQRRDLLEELRRPMRALTLPGHLVGELDAALDQVESQWDGSGAPWWAVRSSASDEDATDASAAGAYASLLGVPRKALAAGIVRIWSSLWSEAAVARARRGGAARPPAMAVVLQPMVPARAAGVAYSRHPLTGQRHVVVINAVVGLAEPLVSGAVTPDSYTVDGSAPDRTPVLREQFVAEKPVAKILGRHGLLDEVLPESARTSPALSEPEAIELAGLVSQVDRALRIPIDVEWAKDETGFWLVQARPIAAGGAAARWTDATCTWSRANFKETLPELPSPLGLSFLYEFMEHNIVRHYVSLGCQVPNGVSSVRVINGRPYINVSLFHSFMRQLGGDPEQVTEHMGGLGAPVMKGPPRLPWWRLAKAGLVMEWRIRRAARRAPTWFSEMRTLTTDVKVTLAGADIVSLIEEMTRLNLRLRREDLTFAIVAAVSQGFYYLGLLLSRRFGDNWRRLLNASLQGFGTVISAQQSGRLTDLAEVARREQAVHDFFSRDPWRPDLFRDRLAGTPFLRGFDAYLADYGHRALGESDVMSPRFAETPESVLGVIRTYLAAPPAKSPHLTRADLVLARNEALREIRKGLAWRRHEWWLFQQGHRRLARFLELREANRHHLMYFSSAARWAELALADRLLAAGRLETRDDVFFLAGEEVRTIGRGDAPDIREIVAARRAERERNAGLTAPDIVYGTAELLSERSKQEKTGQAGEADAALTGIPISVGVAEGPVRLIRSPADAVKIVRGDIIVASVIDPGLAPWFGLAGGLVAEMGGVLSHGSIIARELGLPAVANVPGIMRTLQDGEWIVVDGERGEITRRGVERGQSSPASGPPTTSS